MPRRGFPLPASQRSVCGTRGSADARDAKAFTLDTEGGLFLNGGTSRKSELVRPAS